MKRLRCLGLLLACAPAWAASTAQAAEPRPTGAGAVAESRATAGLHPAAREVLQSPDGRWTAYLVSAEDDPSAAGLWLRGPGTPPAGRRLAPRAQAEPERNLSGFNNLAFSPDSRALYFLTTAWTTSDALHRLPLEGGAPAYLGPANSVQPIAQGRHAGELIVQRHQYRPGGGSHEAYCLLSADGQLLRELGDDPAALNALLR